MLPLCQLRRRCSYFRSVEFWVSCEDLEANTCYSLLWYSICLVGSIHNKATRKSNRKTNFKNVMPRSMYVYSVLQRLRVLIKDVRGSEKRRRTLLISFLGLGLLGLTTLVFVALSIAGVEKPHDQQPLCSKPSIRREWRTLTDSEKRGYITAVQCLQSTPSQMKVNASRFDDYPWIHQNVGKISQ